MYPLKMTLAVGVGYAVANDEGEHKSLTGAGYEPAFVAHAAEPEPVTKEVAPVVMRKAGRPKKDA